MNGVSLKYFGLLVSFGGAILQGWALLTALANAFVNVNAVHRTPLPAWVLWLGLGGCLFAVFGLSFCARMKGRSWLWGLLGLGMCPGWLVGALALLLLPDLPFKHAAEFQRPAAN